MDQANLPRYRYTVDQQDVITWVSPLWLAFARENGAPQLTQEAVVGRPLHKFIAGEETQQLYRTLLQRVRANNASTIIPFRCDSPTLRRYMRLELIPEANGVVQLDGVLERVEQTVPYNLLDSDFPRSVQMLTLCSCCKRILMENCGWLEIGAVAERLNLLHKNIAPKLRHSICPECLAVAHRDSIPKNHDPSTATVCP